MRISCVLEMHVQSLRSWFCTEILASARERFPPALRVRLAAVAAVTVVLAGAADADLIGSGWAVAWFLIEVAIAAIWRRRLHHVLHAIETPERDLGLLADLLARVEREPFTSARLVALQQALVTDGVPPSRRVARLRHMLSWLARIPS